jgi:hypothetical protein
MADMRTSSAIWLGLLASQMETEDRVYLLHRTAPLMMWWTAPAPGDESP